MLDPVTNRYADALFSVSKKRGILDAVRRDVETLARDLSAPQAEGFYVDARIPIGERRKRVLARMAGMNDILRDFVALLFDKRRESVLEGLGQAFHLRVLGERGAAEGVVESARPLGASEISRLATALGRRLGKSVSLENKINPDLVGGVRVVVGSNMVDCSIKGRLEGLRRRMLDAPLPSPQEV